MGGRQKNMLYLASNLITNMNSFYTKISAKVPSDFTKPTTSFKKHVWLSVFGLLFFIGLYLGLTIWFGKLAYNLFVDANNFVVENIEGNYNSKKNNS